MKNTLRYVIEHHVPDENTLLHDASVVQAKHLLQCGANVNAASANGKTALDVTTSIPKAKVLLKFGALIGERTLENAVRRDDFKMAKLLLEAKANPSLGMQLLHAKDQKMVQLILEHGADPSFLQHGTSALHLLDNAQFPEIIKRASDLEKRDACGRTPLAHALEKGCNKVAALLVKHGAKLDAKDNADSAALKELKIKRKRTETLSPREPKRSKAACSGCHKVRVLPFMGDDEERFCRDCVGMCCSCKGDEPLKKDSKCSDCDGRMCHDCFRDAFVCRDCCQVTCQSCVEDWDAEVEPGSCLRCHKASVSESENYSE